MCLGEKRRKRKQNGRILKGRWGIRKVEALAKLKVTGGVISESARIGCLAL